MVCATTAKILSRRGGAGVVRRWARAVERRLDRVLCYPADAIRGLEVGLVELEFDLAAVRGGAAPSEVRLIHSSGGRSLDAAALSAVATLGDLPDPPHEAQGDCVLIRARFGRPE